MTLDERDYMRQRSYGIGDRRRGLGNGPMAAIIVVAVVIAGIWFYQKSQDLGAAEGSPLVNCRWRSEPA